MIEISRLDTIIEEVMAGREAFQVDRSVSAANQIKLLVDGPEGINLKELAAISRAIEAELDREQEDFEITVASPGVGEPLQVPQQYQQNLGRILKVKTRDGEELKGRLADWDGEKLTLNWKTRQPKAKGKGKETVEKQAVLHIESIQETRVQIEFK